MEFLEFVAEVASRPEFVAEFNRLTNSNVTFTDDRTPLERAIDQVTGRQAEMDANEQEDVINFVSFCLFDLWPRVPQELKSPVYAIH